ncbi:MAG: hypothetical protein AAGE65_02935 [Planctomycetota bacterium]
MSTASRIFGLVITLAAGTLLSFQARAEPAVEPERAELGWTRYAPNYQEATLEQVVDEFREKTVDALFVNWPALRTLEITKEETVTLQSGPIPGRLVLLVALRSLEPADIGPLDRITLKETDGVLEVNLFREVMPGGEARVYDIRDLARDQAEFPQDRPTEQIIQIITESVGFPEEWESQRSTVKALNGNLIIKTTAQNHRQVESVLDNLRKQS